jgi:hypothetical protein
MSIATSLQGFLEAVGTALRPVLFSKGTSSTFSAASWTRRSMPFSDHLRRPDPERQTSAAVQTFCCADFLLCRLSAV